MGLGKLLPNVVEYLDREQIDTAVYERRQIGLGLLHVVQDLVGLFVGHDATVVDRLGLGCLGAQNRESLTAAVSRMKLDHLL